MAEMLGRACRDLRVHVKAVAATFAATAAAQSVEIPDAEVTAHSQESSEMCDDYYEKMGQLTEKARPCLERLGEAAVLTCKVEATPGRGNRTECMKQFLANFYDLMVQESIANRLQENRLSEDHHHDLCMHAAGHLFTYSRHKFWDIVHCLPQNVEHELRQRSVHCSENTALAPTSAAEAEVLYYERGVSWQDEYTEDDLVAVRRLIRSAVDAVVVDWD